MDAAVAEEGNTNFELTLPEGADNLTFWTAQTGGTQLIPDANGVLETLEMPSSGTYNGTVWVENDAPATVQFDPSCAILAEVLPASGASPAAAASVVASPMVGDARVVSATYQVTGFQFTATTGAGAFDVGMGQKPGQAVDDWGAQLVDYCNKIADGADPALSTSVKQVATKMLNANPANLVVTNVKITLVVNVQYKYTYCSTAGAWRSPLWYWSDKQEAVPIEIAAEDTGGCGGELLTDPLGRQAILNAATKARPTALNILIMGG